MGRGRGGWGVLWWWIGGKVCSFMGRWGCVGLFGGGWRRNWHAYGEICGWVLLTLIFMSK